jgi:hypothetical protein
VLDEFDHYVQEFMSRNSVNQTRHVQEMLDDLKIKRENLLVRRREMIPLPNFFSLIKSFSCHKMILLTAVSPI